jgi:hypothetical protein
MASSLARVRPLAERSIQGSVHCSTKPVFACGVKRVSARWRMQLETDFISRLPFHVSRHSSQKHIAYF